MDRRTFITSSAIAAGGVAAGRLPAISSARAEPAPLPFAHGVAAGDPTPDALIIWTRVTPSPEATPGSGQGPAATVRWAVATDPGLREVVRSGEVATDAARDHTVKVDVTGLRAATQYFYGFTHAGERSAVGKARTAPAADAVSALRFALASCANFEGGYYAAYRAIAEREDLDFVLHVGDYIYEYQVGYYGEGPAIGREHRPEHDIVTLADYRQRYACYREDPDLRAAHEAHAFIAIWDDHEVANDNWAEGAENHDPETQGSFAERFANALQAYLEWLPVREDPGDLRRLYRRLEFGALATLHMIDSRTYRSEQTSLPITPETDPDVDDPDRTILGRDQKDWFKEGLAGSAATWQLVGNPQMIAPVLFPPLPQELTGQIADVTGLFPRDGVGYNSDQWDGYRAARDEVLRHIADSEIDNTVFLTGDIHSSWACDLPVNPGGYPATSPSVAVELVGTSITSDNLDEITGSPPRTSSIAVEEMILANNRHIKLLEFDSHGFSVVDVTGERTQMDWWYLRSTSSPSRPQHDVDAELVYAQSWKADVGTNEVSPAEGPVAQRAAAPVRIAGRDRYATAAAVSAANFAPGLPVAYVATGEDFPDALVGGVIAARGGAPVLLTRRDELPKVTAAELERLDAGRIVVLGGPRAVSEQVAEELAALNAGEVERAAGDNRYATAALLSRQSFAPGSDVLVATGLRFPDALAGASAAVLAQGPILLTAADELPRPTMAELERLAPGSITVLGGSSAVSDRVLARLRDLTDGEVERVAGQTRYATAVAISQRAFPAGADTVFAATGEGFADALAGGAVAARRGAPLLLVEPERVPVGVADEVSRLGARNLVILGGQVAVSRNVAAALADRLR